MKTYKTTLSRNIRLALLGSTALAMLQSPISFAQQTPAAEEAVEKLIVTGSRGAPRTVADSPVPVDVFSSDDLSAVAFSDTNDVLKTLVPSYSLSRQPISDGGTFIRPASLRGMPTDKTLVLVNSKRRHRSALVEIGGSGTQGPDIATIPASALKTVEVLRDGAAAQYGSDAIAGVINFHLKDNSEGGSLSVDWGQYYEGDGQNITVSGNIGFALGDKGFLSISGEISEADATHRGEQYCESWFCLDKNNPVYDPEAWYATYVNDPAFMAGVDQLNSVAGSGVVQPWGQPESEATRLFFNAGYDLNDSTKLYAFGNYSKSKANGAFYYRYPTNGTIEDLRLADGSIYNPLTKFSGGFTPRFYGDVYDYSFATGIEGVLDNGLSYDISGRFGHSEVKYTLTTTINPSMGPDSPTSFRPGDLINEELQFQADFVKDFEVAGLDSPLVVAFGFSYMDESYELVAGDEASYTAGPYSGADPWNLCNDDLTPTTAGATAIANGSTLNCADSSDPVYKVVGVGSNGFPGYGPDYTGKYTRDSYSAYVDLSANVTERLFLQGAARYEDYSDFGSELVGKFAFKYDLTDTYGLRGSIGTGFRAPTPGQQGTTNVSTRLPEGFPVATGLFPAGGPIAAALGASPLKPETSTNYTLGLTADYGKLTVTTDFYRIELADRLYAVSTLNVSTDSTATSPSGIAAYENYLALVDAGVSGAETIGGVFYFQNAFDTVTQGLDIVANYSFSSDYGLTTLTGSLNYNETELDSDASAYLNAEDQYDLENGTPKYRGVFSVKQAIGDLTLLARANYYSSYKNSDGSDTITYIQEYGSEWFFDLEASYRLTDIITVTVGGRNIFDTYPDKTNKLYSSDECCGSIYNSGSIVDWQGGYYYLKFSAQF